MADELWGIRKRLFLILCNYLRISSLFRAFLRSLLGKTRSLLGKICSLLVFPSSLLRNGRKSWVESRGVFFASRPLHSSTSRPLKNSADSPTSRLSTYDFRKSYLRKFFSDLGKFFSDLVFPSSDFRKGSRSAPRTIPIP